MKKQLDALVIIFWRIPRTEALSEVTKSISWIIWYVWKARNAKVFNALDQELSDILALALKESREWIQANEPDPPPETVLQPEIIPLPGLFACFVDGSWKVEEATSGVGWVLQLQDGTTDLVGLQGHRRSLSPLYSEIHGLLWAMQSLLRENRFCSVFVTDSMELVNMVATPEQWPNFGPELRDLAFLRDSYPEFELIYRQRQNNKRADLLARNARTHNKIFSFIGTSVPYWFSDADNVFS